MTPLPDPVATTHTTRPLFSQDQMLAYGDARAAAERERCAKLCESLTVNRPDDHPANYYDGGCRTCAKAIREQTP